MNIDDMISMAFEQGTGMKRSSVTRTKRFRELLAKMQGDSQVTAYERAEMQYLGERLADAAFKRLPAKIRKTADDYQDKVMIKSCANLFVNLGLRTDRLREQSGTQNDAISEGVLPRQYSLGLRPAIRPNCLGLSQAMIGWARAAGAECALVDVLQLNDIDYYVGMYRGHLLMGSALQDVPYFSATRRMQRDAQKVAAAFAKNIHFWANNDRAHHALYITKKGTTGVVIDPYMRVITFINAKRRFIAKTRHGLRYNNATKYIKLQPHVGSTFEVSADLTKAILLKFESFVKDYTLDSWSELEEFIDQLADAFAMFARDVIDASGAGELKDTPPLANASKDAIVGEFMNAGWSSLMNEEERALLADETVPIDERYSSVMRRNHTKRRFEQVVNRLVGQFLEYVYKLQVQEFTRRKAHPLIELNAPEYHLAVMTVNHLAMVNDVDASDLLRHRPFSQALIRDILPNVLTSNDIRVKQAYGLSRKRLRALDDEKIMPEIRTSISLERN